MCVCVYVCGNVCLCVFVSGRVNKSVFVGDRVGAGVFVCGGVFVRKCIYVTKKHIDRYRSTDRR